MDVEYKIENLTKFLFSIYTKKSGKILNFYSSQLETLWRVSTNSGQDRDASLISRILGRERSRQQSEIFNERRATCFGTRETFYTAQKQKSLSNEEKASRPPVRRRSSAYDRYLTDIRDMICARCGGTRIPNKNINCTCQGSEGRRAARRERERDRERRPTGLSTRTHVVRVRMCVRAYTPSHETV